MSSAMGTIGYPKHAERQARGEEYPFTKFDIAALGIIDAPDFTHVRRVGWDFLLPSATAAARSLSPAAVRH